MHAVVSASVGMTATGLFCRCGLSCCSQEAKKAFMSMNRCRSGIGGTSFESLVHSGQVYKHTLVHYDSEKNASIFPPVSPFEPFRSSCILDLVTLHRPRIYNGIPIMPQKVYIETVGCQMNVLDSELVIGGAAQARLHAHRIAGRSRRDALQHLLRARTRGRENLLRARSRGQHLKLPQSGGGHRGARLHGARRTKS